jgi:hypothetical protein
LELTAPRYANLATTDGGFFGKGLYSAYEAEYSYRVYGKGALILNWVASYSTYPVIHGDMAKLSTKGNYANYDSHFVPVVPENPKNPYEVNYYPTKPKQAATYHEMVVFDNGQCLPRYLVTLQADGPGAHSTPAIKATKPTISNTTTTTTTASNKEIEAKLAAALAAQKKAEEELAKLKEKANKDADYLILTSKKLLMI